MQSMEVNGIPVSFSKDTIAGGDTLIWIILDSVMFVNNSGGDADAFFEPGERLVITDLLKLTDGIRPRVMETTLMVACRIARVIRRGGERIGAIFILGDSLNVLKDSRQLIPNPFHGHEDRLRQITNPDIHDQHEQ